MLNCTILLALLAGVPSHRGFVSTVEASAAVAAAPLAASASLDEILEALQARGANLTAFDADVTLREKKEDEGTVTTRAGRVLYSKSGDGNAKVRVKFDTRDEGDGPKPYVKEYLLANEWLVERDYGKKKEDRTQVLRPGEKVNLLKLGEGPFPLPIGQDPAEVKRQFEVTKLEPENDAPRLKLVPVKGTKLASKLSEITVTIDPATRFPTVIATADRSHTTTRTTELKNIRVNEGCKLTDGDFALPAINVGTGPGEWKQSENPMAD